MKIFKPSHFERSIPDYDQAIRLDLLCPRAYSNRGFAENDRGQYQQAFDDLDKLPSKASAKRQVRAEVPEWAQMAIDGLPNADRILTQVLLEENNGLVEVNLEHQDKVEKEFQKPEDDLAKGDADQDALKHADSIRHYRKAWRRVEYAVKEATRV